MITGLVSRASFKYYQSTFKRRFYAIPNSTCIGLHGVKSPWLQSKCTSRSSFNRRPTGVRFIHRIQGASTRDMAELEDRLYSILGSSVKDPEVEMDLKTLGWLKRGIALSEDGTVQILLRLPTLLHPSLDQLKEETKNAAKNELEKWAIERGIELEAKVNVEAVPSRPASWLVKDEEDQKELESRLGPGLANVAHFVSVYSCKGGVGKSTVAVNLAYELAKMGGRVGLLDLDVYGPSLPVLVKPSDPAVRKSPLGSGMVYPIEHEGVKLLSLGFVSANSGVPGSGQDNGAAVLRGPMAGKVVTQLLKGTHWGDLDVLILDLPPGTGDVQLTICQDIDMSGAVGVTTPSKLAIADARKGIEMFSTMGIPTMAMVENMSYFEVDGVKYFPFGKGFSDFLKEDKAIVGLDAGSICQLPLSEAANEANDSGVPLTISRPSQAKRDLEAFRKLAEAVTKELFRLPYSKRDDHNFVVFEDGKEKFNLSTIQLSKDNDSLLLRIFSEEGALQKRFDPKELRNRDPKTGDVILDSNNSLQIEDDSMVEVYRSASEQKVSSPLVKRVDKKAKVGFEVAWSDGAKFIYSHRAIAKAAGGSLI